MLCVRFSKRNNQAKVSYGFICLKKNQYFFKWILLTIFFGFFFLFCSCDEPSSCKLYVWLCRFHFFCAILIEQWEFRVACALAHSVGSARRRSGSPNPSRLARTCTHTHTLTSSTAWKKNANGPRESSSELIKRLAAASQSPHFINIQWRVYLRTDCRVELASIAAVACKSNYLFNLLKFFWLPRVFCAKTIFF